MVITKIAQNDPFETDIKNERILSLFNQKVEGDNIFWKKSPAYKSPQGSVIHTYLGYVLPPGNRNPLPTQVYSFNLSISFLYDDEQTNLRQVNVDLFLNARNTPSGEGEQKIASWIFKNERSINTLLKPFIQTEFGVDMGMMPHEEAAEKQRQIDIAERGSVTRHMFGKEVVEGIRLTRNKSSDFGDAKAIEIYVYKSPASFQTEDLYKTAYKIINLENKTSSEETVKFSGSLEHALNQYDEVVARARANKYVDESSKLDPYIPVGANTTNYDFVLRRFKNEAEESPDEQVENNIDIDSTLLDDVFGSSNGVARMAQDFEGYFTGDIPYYAINNLGSPSVDASQVSSMFGKTNDAILLVNQFDSSLLANVSFIFNFSKSGAYGVYLSELDRVIKTKALQLRLESEGYDVKPDKNGMLMAYPKEESKSQEEIQKDIDRLYADLESKGGTAFGINMNSVLNAAKQDAVATQSKDPDIWQWMALLHLGGTIVHEAVHAKGSHEEGPSESAEDKFINWALPKINEQYMKSLDERGESELFAPIVIGNGTRHAKSSTWYKQAQMSNYMPQSIMGKPRGSDLAGRSGVYVPEEGMADWGMLAQQNQNIPLEERLGRGYMSPLPPDLSQEHDSYEEQLRKYTRDDRKINPNDTMEELLAEDHTEENTAYKSIEELLDERRPKPLIIPLNKNASSNKIKKVEASENKIIKIATLFGWMNNLEISDGSTIPGLGDRVMAWEDRDEDFAWTEKDIRGQSRYNPSYDIKGFYYRWIDPRLKPQLFDDMTRDYSGTHPAKRFASKDKELLKDDEVAKDVCRLFNIMSVTKKMIKKKQIPATRFVMTEDVLPIVEASICNCPEIDVFIRCLGRADDGEKIYASWMFSKEVNPKDIEKAEEMFVGESDPDEAFLENLLKTKERRSKTIKTIIKTVKNICEDYGIKDVYLVGGYPRALVAGEPLYTVEDLDFSGAWANQSIKVGGLLAEKLKVKDVQLFHRTMTLSFVYKGVKVDFKGNFSPIEIRSKMREEDIPTTPLNMDIYNRDFTINMMVYDINKEEVFDICGRSVQDLQSKVIKTYFDPNYICSQNPLIILRALKFKTRGYEIDPSLEKAMICNVPLLFDGRYSHSRLKIAKDTIEEGNKDLANELFEEYGLNKIKEI